MASHKTLSIKNIEDFIKTLDGINICYGAVLISKYPNIKESFGYQYQSMNGYWKHSKCSKIILEKRQVLIKIEFVPVT